MNTDLGKMKTGIQWAVGILTPLLVSYGLPPEKIGLWGSVAAELLPPLAMAAWALWERTHKNVLKEAGAILQTPGLDGRPSGTIVVSPEAKDGAAAAADDPNVKNVNYGDVK